MYYVVYKILFINWFYNNCFRDLDTCILYTIYIIWNPMKNYPIILLSYDGVLLKGRISLKMKKYSFGVNKIQNTQDYKLVKRCI